MSRPPAPLLSPDGCQAKQAGRPAVTSVAADMHSRSCCRSLSPDWYIFNDECAPSQLPRHNLR